MKDDVGIIDELPPKWLRVPKAVKYSGLSRSLLYEKITAHEIDSICIRKRGAIRGVRLVSVASIDAFLESHADRDRTATQD